jgi:hypothetical protein
MICQGFVGLFLRFAGGSDQEILASREETEILASREEVEIVARWEETEILANWGSGDACEPREAQVRGGG